MTAGHMTHAEKKSRRASFLNNCKALCLNNSKQNIHWFFWSGHANGHIARVRGQRDRNSTSPLQEIGTAMPSMVGGR